MGYCNEKAASLNQFSIPQAIMPPITNENEDSHEHTQMRYTIGNSIRQRIIPTFAYFVNLLELFMIHINCIDNKPDCVKNDVHANKIDSLFHFNTIATPVPMDFLKNRILL